MKLQINKNYFAFSVVLLIAEVLIAVYLKTGFIRHTFGDYLVVILLFCLIKSFTNTNSFVIAIGVLCFSFLIEFLQLVNIIQLLNFQNNHLIKIILGTTFQITDLVAYTVGIITIIIFEYKIYKLWIT
ncbi:DUF2809 domain-containing protein [Algibacter aquimarinus]|uniref:DUF2809 domain-containing protein n=1 Tax=Algibacter aquimarinus TaxID=1136748 RepID=A0ABP9H242_9FLAO